jgi:hypothetical protein
MHLGSHHSVAPIALESPPYLGTGTAIAPALALLGDLRSSSCEEARRQARRGATARATRFRGSSPTVNGVSSRPFFLGFRTPVAAKSWGGLPSFCAFLGHRRKALRTFLGPGLGQKGRSFVDFAPTLFSVGQIRRGTAKTDHRKKSRMVPSVTFRWGQWAGIRQPRMSDLRKPEVLRVLRLSQEQVRKCWKNRLSSSKPRAREEPRKSSAEGGA